MTRGEKGRLVWNHSTHCPQLKLRVSVPIRGGYKAIARQGKTVQEVFIVTDLSQKELESTIKEVLNNG